MQQSSADRPNLLNIIAGARPMIAGAILWMLFQAFFLPVAERLHNPPGINPIWYFLAIANLTIIVFCSIKIVTSNQSWHRTFALLAIFYSIWILWVLGSVDFKRKIWMEANEIRYQKMRYDNR